MALNRLDQTTLRVKDLEESTAWYTEGLGFDVLDRRPGEVDLSLATDHVDLTLVEGGHGLVSFAFGVDDADLLDHYDGRLKAAGLATERRAEPRLGVAEALRFELPSGHTMELQTGSGSRVAGEHNEKWDGSSKAPLDLDHITVVTDRVGPNVDFVGETLDIRPTYLYPSPDGDDWFGIWARSSDYHHDLAFIQVPENTSALHHVAVKVDGIHHMQLLADSLYAGQRRLEYGPGRHPGINLFVYVFEPAGNRIELSAEMPLIPDDEEPVKLAPDTPINAWSEYVPDSFLFVAS
jgi:catechol 2,3-dioxygenase